MLPNRGCLRCLPSSCAGVLCVWLTTTAARFHGARLDVPDSPKVPHLGATATSGPLFHCPVVLNNYSQPFITTHSCSTSGAQSGVVHIHMEKRRQPRYARAQGRPSNRKSEYHLRVHRAALRPRLPRPVLPCTAQQNGRRVWCWPYVTWNLRIHISIQLQLRNLNRILRRRVF